MEFQLRESRTIDNLQLEVQHFVADDGRVHHFHLNSESKENTFAVTVRTAPTDSTGVAHILEHTVLCGSGRYPVRDPFFLMLRRSLSSFMNAMTAPDWTTYLFATAEEEDYSHLAQVYLDAVFHPNLNPLDFAQEGHRLELEEDENRETKLIRKGVVYNEMKGAMSSVTSQLYQQLGSVLFPTTTYGANSGGDPKNIPELTYEAFRHFYDTHYHPHNCTFFSSGNLPPETTHQLIGQACLSRLSEIPEIQIPAEPTWNEPKREECVVAAPESSGTHLLMGWVFPDDQGTASQLDAALLSEILVSSRAAPLRKALLDSQIGTNIGPLTGLDSYGRQRKFFVGLENCSGSAEEFEALVLASLKRVTEEGLSKKDIASALHQFELSIRSLGGDSLPVGLELSLAMADNAIHRRDPIAAIDLTSELQSLNERATPEYISRLVKRLLLENNHRVTLAASPSEAIHKQEAENLEAILAERLENMPDSQVAELRDQAQKLAERQSLEDDTNVLPLIDIAQIDRKPRKRHAPGHERAGIDGFAVATNGLMHLEIELSHSISSLNQLKRLRTLTLLIGSTGHGDLSAEQAQAYTRSISGGVHLGAELEVPCSNSSDAMHQRARLVLSSEGLESNTDAILALLHDKWQQFHLKDHSVIKEVLTTNASRQRMRIAGAGHSYAMSAAMAGIHSNAAISESMGGLTRVAELQKLAKLPIEELLALLEDAGMLLRDANPIAGAVVATPQSIDACLRSVADKFAANSADKPDLTAPALTGNTAWLDNMDAHYCAQAYEGLPYDHELSAALQLAGPVLRNGYLHNAIREIGGAYGSGAAYNRTSRAFTLFSYRDPNVDHTYKHFDVAMARYSETAPTQEETDDAKRNVISGMQKSQSLPTQVLDDWHATRLGVTVHDAAWREKLLDTSAEDIRHALEIVASSKTVRALVAPVSSRDAAESLGLAVKRVSDD